MTGLLARDYDLVMGEEYPGLPAARVPEVDEEDLLDDPFHLAVPPSGPFADARSVAELGAAAWVMDPAALTSGQWERGLCRSAGFEPDVRFTTPDPLMHLHLVETAHAVALVPDLMVRSRPHRARLVPLRGAQQSHDPGAVGSLVDVIAQEHDPPRPPVAVPVDVLQHRHEQVGAAMEVADGVGQGHGAGSGGQGAKDVNAQERCNETRR